MASCRLMRLCQNINPTKILLGRVMTNILPPTPEAPPNTVSVVEIIARIQTVVKVFSQNKIIRFVSGVKNEEQ